MSSCAMRSATATAHRRATARLSQSRRFGIDRGNVALRLKLVPHPPYRLEMPRPRGIRFDLRTQPADVNGHRRRLPGELVVPDRGHQLVAREHLVRVRRQMEEQVEFLCRECDVAGP